MFGLTIKNSKTLLFPLLFWLVLPYNTPAQVRDLFITIHLRGVFESKTSLLYWSDSRLFKAIKETDGIRNGQTVKITVPKENLPGEFVLRFDYKEKKESTPYPSEKYLLINNQDIELWVNPIYCNNPDSTWFQEVEIENSAFARFSEINASKKEKIGLLLNFLMNYDDTGSGVYEEAIKEYEHRRKDYNLWLADYILKENALFVSNLYTLEYIPEISWKGSETERKWNRINHYFDGIDFKNPGLIKLSGFIKYMDNYVNLYGEMAVTVPLRDSLFSLAGSTAIEKAKIGDPLIYGWMVDYFYKGYESNGIDAGIRILEPYMNDPNCLTSKRREISKRLEGIKTLTAGVRAPAIKMVDFKGKDFELYDLVTDCKYILLLFWSAGCSHCVEMVDKLYPWNVREENYERIKVIAVSLDDNETDISSWKKKAASMDAWEHLGDPEGVRSKVAADYFVLSTPVMFILDGKTKEIRATPGTLDEIISFLK